MLGLKLNHVSKRGPWNGCILKPFGINGVKQGGVLSTFLCKHGQKNPQTWDEWYRMPCWSAIYWIILQHCSSPRISFDHIMNPKICSMCMMSLPMNIPWNLIQEKKCMHFYGKSVCTDISLSRTRETHPGAIMSSNSVQFCHRNPVTNMMFKWNDATFIVMKISICKIQMFSCWHMLGKQIIHVILHLFL